MSKWAYYQDIDEEKCEWVRELIKAGVVTDGEVDCRDIKLVTADDVRGFRRVHLFCGIAVWDYALNLANWDDREVWTGSCPCPSFSCAGKGEGFDDPRHLWPDWYRLIRERRPANVFGEQVAAAIGHGWLDLVQTDLESQKYAIGKAVLTAAGAGAPHIRQRLYFVAQRQNADVGRRTAGSFADGARAVQVVTRLSGAQCGDAGECADTDGRQSRNGDLQRSGEQRLLAEDRGTSSGPDSERNGRRSDLTLREAQGRIADGRDSATSERPHPKLPESARLGERCGEAVSIAEAEGIAVRRESIREHANRIGATRGFWADCDWWYGRDGKYRPIKPGIQPLAHGVTGRVLKLRGAGDAICAETAKAFIESYLEIGD